MDVQASISAARFSEGLTIQQFVDSMEKNRDLFEANYNNFTFTPDDEQFLRNLSVPLNALVLAEDWCGDVLRYLPVFARMAETAPAWNVRVFRREANLDLADKWLRQGKYRSIPVIVVLDEGLRELDHFIERPTAVYEAEAQARRAFATQHPELPDSNLPSTEMSEQTLALYVPFMRRFRAENNLKWQQLFVDEIRAGLQGAGLALLAPR